MKKKFFLFGSERGQSLVELAISLVILLWLLSGAVEFGIALFQYVQLRDAAQEGALFGSINPNQPDQIIARARAASNSPIDLTDTGIVTVEVFVDNAATPADENIPYTNGSYADYDCEGNGIKVVVSYKHHLFMPFMPQILGIKEIPLSAEVIDTILTPPPPCT
jgi:Flp pilus assembly protein TadG